MRYIARCIFHERQDTTDNGNSDLLRGRQEYSFLERLQCPFWRAISVNTIRWNNYGNCSSSLTIPSRQFRDYDHCCIRLSTAIDFAFISSTAGLLCCQVNCYPRKARFRFLHLPSSRSKHKDLGKAQELRGMDESRVAVGSRHAIPMDSWVLRIPSRSRRSRILHEMLDASRLHLAPIVLRIEGSNRYTEWFAT
jgi:hypothetical protein